jgi:hypothetical protein
LGRKIDYLRSNILLNKNLHDGNALKKNSLILLEAKLSGSLQKHG